MIKPEQTDLHARMAQRLGIDLDQSFDQSTNIGMLAQHGIALRCADCRERDTCADLLASGKSFNEPPDYC